MLKIQDLFKLMRRRRALSDKLPAYTLRNDPQLETIQSLDVQIETMARKLGVNLTQAYKGIEK